MLDGTFTAMRESQSVAFYAWLFCWYVVQYFVVIFFNTALVGAALKLALSRMSVPRTPMVGSLPACCARAASGHATVIPPSADMNSRLLILIVMVRSDAIGPSRHSAQEFSFADTRPSTIAAGAEDRLQCGFEVCRRKAARVAARTHFKIYRTLTHGRNIRRRVLTYS